MRTETGPAIQRPAQGKASASATVKSVSSPPSGSAATTPNSQAHTPNIVIQPASQSSQAVDPLSMSPPPTAQGEPRTPAPAGLPGTVTDPALLAENTETSADTGDADISLDRTEPRTAAATIAKSTAAQTQTRFAPHTAHQLAAQISQRFQSGAKVFDIRLDPAELGRVDVRLEVGHDNRVQAVLAAERPETLAELQRSARDLERALQDAGLDVGENGLEFQLRDENGSEEFSGSNDGSNPATGPVLNAYAEGGDLLVTTSPLIETYGFLLQSRDSVDVRV